MNKKNKSKVSNPCSFYFISYTQKYTSVNFVLIWKPLEFSYQTQQKKTINHINKQQWFLLRVLAKKEDLYV